MIGFPLNLFVKNISSYTHIPAFDTQVLFLTDKDARYGTGSYNRILPVL